MQAEEFLGLLHGVRRTPRGWMAQCVSHADKSPSLHIREGEDGRILLHCFAGCSVLDICTALHLTLADLFPANEKPSHQIRHECRQRQAAREEQTRQHHARGLTADVLREAERLVQSARGIPDSHTWPHAKRDRILNQLADTYAVLDREGVLYASAGI